MDAKYLACANLLKEEKCNGWIISNIDSKFTVYELGDPPLNHGVLIGPLDTEKANSICSQCDNYVIKK
jgi:hypothetical protein